MYVHLNEACDEAKRTARKHEKEEEEEEERQRGWRLGFFFFFLPLLQTTLEKERDDLFDVIRLHAIDVRRARPADFLSR